MRLTLQCESPQLLTTVITCLYAIALGLNEMPRVNHGYKLP